MKTNIIFKGLAAIMTAGALAGCSSDYLQVNPVTEVSASTVQTTPEGAELALNGLCGAMYTPYTDYASSLQPNGEGTLMVFYGEVPSSDYFSRFWAYRAPYMLTNDRLRNSATWMCSWPWSYCYNLIAQANTILSGIDNIEKDKEYMQFIKAEALTIRAHAYVRLLQLYGPRWADSREGEKMALVLRTKPGTDEMPLSSMKDVLELIYNDLDTAIEIFDHSSYSRKYIWQPDEDVARGVYARAALLCNDYPTAEKMARDARKDNRYPIMSKEEYMGGFARPNNEWMWANAAEMERSGYWANGSYYACNGAYVDFNHGMGTINYELYKKIPSGDIRAQLFFTPDKLQGNQLSRSSFWNRDICNPSTMSLAKSINMRNQYKRFGAQRVPDGNRELFGLPYVSRDKGEDCEVFFGSQYKFWALNDYGTDSWPFMRGAEMLLTEAEAACHNGNETVARELLIELNKERNDNYTCTKSGEALLEEVKLQRRIELWGEGFSWYDLKRWNQPLVRTPWIAGNINSNNIPQANVLNIPTDANRGWRWIVPLSESQYNSKIDLSQLE